MSTIVIPARYASTRLPGKPLIKIDDIPMIHRVANQCLKSKADRVIVVTDHADILDFCDKIDGVEVTMSDPNIPSGTDRVAKVMKFVNDDVVINVQGDEPFIDPLLIDALIDDLNQHSDVEMNSAFTEIDSTEADNPNCVKVVVDTDGFGMYFSRSPIPYDRDGSSRIPYLKHIGIYGYRRDFLLKYADMDESGLEQTEKLEQLRALENGHRIKMIKTDYNCISVDTKEDVELAEKIAKGEM